MTRDRLNFLFLNIGHFLDHLFTLIFATVAAVAAARLSKDWGLAKDLTYADLARLGLAGFVAFGAFSLPAGWLADKWSRPGMMVVFFIGIGIASILAATAGSPLAIAFWVFVIGVFAAIYHPVGLAMVVENASKTGTGMAIGINGVWGNLGVGSAALATGFMIDQVGWRGAFVLPGVVSIVVGIAYAILVWPDIKAGNPRKAASTAAAASPTQANSATAAEARRALLRLTVIIFFTTAISSIIFQSTTYALPKVFDERLGDIAGSATKVGWFAFLVFAIASIAQLIVGSALDKYGPRRVFMVVALIQVAFFSLMPGQQSWSALLIALGFMLGAFGQIPINDFMIGKMAKSELRASIYGVRYFVSFIALAATMVLIATVHERWGFDTLFRILAATAALIFCAVSLLPDKLPEPSTAPAGPVPAKA